MTFVRLNTTERCILPEESSARLQPLPQLPFPGMNVSLVEGSYLSILPEAHSIFELIFVLSLLGQ